MIEKTVKIPYFYNDNDGQDIAKKLEIIGNVLSLVEENKPFFLDNQALHLVIRASLWLLQNQFQVHFHKGIVAGIIFLTYENLENTTQTQLITLLIDTFTPAHNIKEKENIATIITTIITTIKAACYYCIKEASEKKKPATRTIKNTLN